MKYEIQNLDSLKTEESKIYFSIEISNAGRLRLNASNKRGQKGFTVLTINPDGYLYRCVGIRNVKGLKIDDSAHIEQLE